MWYEQEVFEHQAVFLHAAGSLGMNEYLKRYELLNETDGWAQYFPAQTKINCGWRVDDDRLVGDFEEYKLVLKMDVVIDADRRYGFRPLSSFFWEGTTTGQIGYNLPTGTTTVFSKEYEAPAAGSFDPYGFSAHTHPGGKSLKFIAKRLGGQSFATPQSLFTLEFRSLTVEPGSQSQELNVKPGDYLRLPTLDWSEIGLKWFIGSISASGVDSNRHCAFQKGDIFYLEAVHDIHDVKKGVKDMMSLKGVVLWDDPPQLTFAPGVWSFSGFLRNQLFGQVFAPHDLLAQIPQKVDQTAMLELHSRWPLLFCHPDRAADAKYVRCHRNTVDQILLKYASVNDIDTAMLAKVHKSCDRF
ncbi:unnamed protein product [Prorocentrum cordatum]|uniref:Uncharacterized protein n=2 Tax=Prorocentrum cordatum TaxID=2364126 RepID=A0ABN9UD91_9DINO|nr:unnamed protein product [Polarella glacialis]